MTLLSFGADLQQNLNLSHILHAFQIKDLNKPLTERGTVIMLLELAKATNENHEGKSRKQMMCEQWGMAFYILFITLFN